MQAKALLASGLIAAFLPGCSDRAAKLGNQWGCGPVEGMAQFRAKTPEFILVGEFIETNEAPAAFAELACNLATLHGSADSPLFVGVSEYLGGATDAETRMRERLDELAAKGVPIVIGAIGGDDHPYTIRNRTAAEKEWARNIENKMVLAHASHAVLLMSRTDAIAEPIPPVGDRFSGYDPMATFLPDGEVLALEIRNKPQAGVSAPTIRLYPKMAAGFHGQIALKTLTRPEVKLAKYEPYKQPDRAISISDPRIQSVLESSASREQKINELEAIFDGHPDVVEIGPNRRARLEMLRRLAETAIETHERLAKPTESPPARQRKPDKADPPGVKDGIY